MTGRRVSDHPLPRVGLDRFHIFVPAIMSVGLLFWVITLLRDLVRWRGRQELDRRSRLAGAGAASFVAHPASAPSPLRDGLRHRRSYALVAAVSVGLAGYVLVGATLNYAREGDYSADIAWILALAVLVALAFLVVGLVALVVLATWPDPPASVSAALLAGPLTRAPILPGEHRAGEPGWGTSVAVALTPLAAAVVTLAVDGFSGRLARVDRALASWIADRGALGAVEVLDPTRQPLLALALAALVVLAALRYRPLSPAAAAAAVLVLGGSWLAGSVVERGGPGGTAGGTATPSYPSGTAVVAGALALSLPVVASVLLRRARPVPCRRWRPSPGSPWPSPPCTGARRGPATWPVAPWWARAVACWWSGPWPTRRGTSAARGARGHRRGRGHRSSRPSRWPTGAGRRCGWRPTCWPPSWWWASRCSPPRAGPPATRRVR